MVDVVLVRAFWQLAKWSEARGARVVGVNCESKEARTRRN
jgi:hypothetical protein